MDCVGAAGPHLSPGQGSNCPVGGRSRATPAACRLQGQLQGQYWPTGITQTRILKLSRSDLGRGAQNAPIRYAFPKFMGVMTYSQHVWVRTAGVISGRHDDNLRIIARKYLTSPSCVGKLRRDHNELSSGTLGDSWTSRTTVTRAR